MASIILKLSEQEGMRIESILMDEDAAEALQFLKEVLRPRIRAKGSRSLDSGKTTGIGV
ncbi:MAG: hypothetical protein K9M96_06115 [Deltaproteobacteria bacterium]|nr:hypothetical protein [Deltaproteobacteria bacterium]MCF8119868.1 hypothetical protein [Deltaproteobacteria bacterium]